MCQMADSAIIQIPEKLYLRCEIDLSHFQSQFRHILEPLYQLFEKEVYEWKETYFPVPESMFSNIDRQRVDLGISNCLNVDECVQLSRNQNGESVKLNEEQLRDIRKFGEIRVKSIQFPGKSHVWKINRIFQKGTEETRRDYKKDISRVMRMVIITMRNRVVAKQLSIISALRHVWKGIYLLIDLIFGIPHNNPGNIDTKMREECLQFLTCELNVLKNDQDKLSLFWDYLEKLSCLPRQCGFEILKEYFPLYGDINNIPHGIYQFTTPNGLSIDMRLMHTGLEQRCVDIVLESINEIENSNWFLEFKSNYVQKMYDEFMSVENLKKNVLSDGFKLKASKIYDLICLKCEQDSVPERICNQMIENCKFCLISSEMKEKFKQIWLEFKIQRLENIRVLHPYLSMISSWMRQQLGNILNEFLEKHQYTLVKMVIDKCAAEELRQHEYFMKRYLLFQKERKQLITNQLLANSSFPDREYEHSARMLLPRYWKVANTVTKEGKNCFEIDKYKTLTWSSRYPLWRWINYFLRTYMLMLTIGQFLLIDLPLRSRVSYLSLFCRKPFTYDQYFESSSGEVGEPEDARTIPTLWSRLRKLWFNVWKSRDKFENVAFMGLLDKSVARQFHRIWVIGFKGAVGTVGIVIVMSILCIFTSTLSVILGVLVPIWVPFLTVTLFFGSVIFYDFEAAERNTIRLLRVFQAIFWHIFWCGCLQFCFQVILVMMVLPVLVLLGIIWTFLRFTLRSSWDGLMFYIVLKKYAHIPAVNDFMAKRISGPGLAYEYEILVLPEHVFTGLRSLMEKYELDLWLRQVEKIIEEPLTNYRQFLDETVQPLNITLDYSNETVSRLLEKQKEALKIVKQDYNNRIKMLNIFPLAGLGNKEKLRMSSKDLKTVLEKSEKLWNQFYADRILPRLEQLNMVEDNWWNDQNITKHDMKNLSLNNLIYLFGEHILLPIEECDEVFKLETNEITMRTYIDMFVTEDYQDDLDSISIISPNWNKGVSMEYCQLKLRDLRLSSFPSNLFFFRKDLSLPWPLESCPNYKDENRRRLKWIKKVIDWTKGKGKGYENSKLDEEVAVQCGSNYIANFTLYHPVIICALFHLRDRDNAMVYLDHHAVYDGIHKSISKPYSQEFFEANLAQSINYSINSLDDNYSDGDLQQVLLYEQC